MIVYRAGRVWRDEYLDRVILMHGTVAGEARGHQGGGVRVSAGETEVEPHAVLAQSGLGGRGPVLRAHDVEVAEHGRLLPTGVVQLAVHDWRRVNARHFQRLGPGAGNRQRERQQQQRSAHGGASPLAGPIVVPVSEVQFGAGLAASCTYRKRPAGSCLRAGPCESGDARCGEATGRSSPIPGSCPE